MLFLVSYFILASILVFQGLHLVGEQTEPLGTLPEQVGLPPPTSFAWGAFLMIPACLPRRLAARIWAPKVEREELCVELSRGCYGAPDKARNSHGAILLLNFGPRNAPLEAEYYSELIPAKCDPLKPLIWCWQMFDTSPLN